MTDNVTTAERHSTWHVCVEVFWALAAIAGTLWFLAWWVLAGFAGLVFFGSWLESLGADFWTTTNSAPLRRSVEWEWKLLAALPRVLPPLLQSVLLCLHARRRTDHPNLIRWSLRLGLGWALYVILDAALRIDSVFGSVWEAVVWFASLALAASALPAAMLWYLHRKRMLRECQ